MGIERELNNNNNFESIDYFESDSGEGFLIGEHLNGRTVTFKLRNEFGFRKILNKYSFKDDGKNNRLTYSQSEFVDLYKFTNEKIKVLIYDEQNIRFIEESLDYDKYILLHSHDMYQVETTDDRSAIIERDYFYFTDEQINEEENQLEYTIRKNDIDYQIKTRNKILNDKWYIIDGYSTDLQPSYDNLKFDETFSMSTITDFGMYESSKGNYVLDKYEVIFKRIGDIIIAQYSNIPDRQTETITRYKVLHPLLAELLIDLHDSV